MGRDLNATARRLVLPGLVLVALALWYFSSGHQVTPSDVARDATLSVGDSANPLAQPPARAQSTSPTASTQKPLGVAGSPALRPAPDVPERVAPASARQKLYALWQREQPDPKWTAEADAFLRESATAVGAKIVLAEPVSCRQSVCRAVLDASDPAAFAELSQVGWDKEAVGFPVPKQEAGARYELYVAKPKSELAALFRGRRSGLPPVPAQSATTPASQSQRAPGTPP